MRMHLQGKSLRRMSPEQLLARSEWAQTTTEEMMMARSRRPRLAG